MPNSRLTLTFIDYDSESSTFSIAGGEINSGNFVASDAKLDRIRAAVADVSLGELRKEQRVYEEDLISGTPPPETYAQRELKWLVTYTDLTTLRKGTVEIPVADTSLLDATSKKMMDVTHAKYIELKEALEDYMVSVSEHNVEIGDVVLVGRNV